MDDDELLKRPDHYVILPLPEDESGFIDPVYLREAKLIPAMMMLGLSGMFKPDEIAELPDGFMYMPEKSNPDYIGELGEKFHRILEMPERAAKQDPALLPYIRTKDIGDGFLIDKWFLIGCFDAMTLHASLDWVTTYVCDDDNEDAQFALYADLFYRLKKRAISGELFVPFGRDIFLNVQCRNREEAGRHYSIIIDRTDFFTFLVEDSGLSAERLPGIVLIAYEREKGAIPLFDQPQEPDRDAPSSPDSDIIIMTELMDYARNVAGRQVSRGTIRRTLIRENVPPIDTVLVDKAKCYVFPRPEAEAAIRKWVDQNKKR